MPPLLLTKGNSLNSVNILIKLMIKYFFDIFLEDKYHEDTKLSDNLDFLVDLINEFINISGEKNYVMFIEEYFKKYKYQYNNLTLNFICSFFTGLNPS